MRLGTWGLSGLGTLSLIGRQASSPKPQAAAGWAGGNSEFQISQGPFRFGGGWAAFLIPNSSFLIC
jgi:hypothetical protein